MNTATANNTLTDDRDEFLRNAKKVKNDNKTEKPAKVRKHPVLGKPILGGILLTIYAFFFYQIIAAYGDPHDTMTAYGLSCVLGGALLFLIHRLWFGKEYKGAFSLDFTKDRTVLIALGIFTASLAVLSLPGYMLQGFAGLTFAGLATSLGAGVAEEATFRSLPISTMMRSYKDKNRYLAALILPAILFGSTHFMNLISGQDMSYTLLQVASAVVTGLLFGALYLRTGSIIPSLLLHFLNDLFCSMDASQAEGIVTNAVQTVDIATTVILMVVSLALTIWLLKGQKENICKTWQKVWNTQA